MEESFNEGYRHIRSWLALSILFYIIEFKDKAEISEEELIKWEDKQLGSLQKILTKVGYAVSPTERVPEAFLK